MQGVAVEFSEVTKRYEAGGVAITAIDNLSLSIKPGKMIAVTGPSGSGKSTFLHLIGAIEMADSGTVQIGELDIGALNRAELVRYRRTVGFVFQRYHLLPALTALENVLAPLIPYRVPFDKRAQARELLAAVGLDARERSLPGQLSGGQQQRVAIARALMVRPTLLLADEPTGNLDSTAGGQVLELLVTLRASYGMTMVIATHEQDVAAQCDRVLSLRDGSLVGDTERS